MDNEMLLQNVLEVAVTEFRKNIANIIEVMKEKTNGYFAAVLEELERYQGDLKDEALEDLDAFTKK